MDAIKVLMVDDESRMRKLVKDFLTRDGYTVLEAGDGEQALDIFMNDKNISLVILDVMMPKMDGWETLKEIRKFSQVPVIMLTAKADERDELMGFDLVQSSSVRHVSSTTQELRLARHLRSLDTRSYWSIPTLLPS